MNNKPAVFVQYQDGIPVTVNTYIAEYGFCKMGYNVYRFTLPIVEEWEIDKKTDPDVMRFASNTIFIGGTFTLFRIMDLLEVPRPITYNPQIVLPEFCNRKMWFEDLGVARQKNSNGEIFFIKPAKDTKLFTGFVAKSEIDFIRLQKLPDNTRVLMSMVIDIKSEYRCFVNRGKLVDYKHYNGDFRIPINLAVVDAAIEAFKDQPVSYTLDFGVLADGSMALIEINDGFSLGYCGIHPATYCQLLEDRWKEITKTDLKR